MGRRAAIILLSAILLVGCKSRVPRQYIQPGKMEDILYDFHLADAMAFGESNYQELSFRRQAYREAALRKHGVTEAELDSSLVYYYRHTEQLHDIYGKLSKRLNNDAIALGATANELSQLEGMTSQGDTATVWSNTQSIVLMPMAPYNHVSFDIEADTTYHKGDKMILSFDGLFIFQSGMRDGVAMMAVTFDNDSTASQVLHCSNDNHFSLQVQDNERIGIKRVSGFIYLGKGSDSNQDNSLKLMTVSNLRLLKMHTNPPKEEPEKDMTGEMIDTTAPLPRLPEGVPEDMRPTMHPRLQKPKL